MAPEGSGNEWFNRVMARFQPDQIVFQPGETLGQVFQRVIGEEEDNVRSSGAEPALMEVKLQVLAELRKKFPTD
ncbi:MAG: hypothetical protein EXR93_11180 [Gemmatimonadetes bacterium]|nr:hypothetical protein [Gemmatimonadota bacterium]